MNLAEHIGLCAEQKSEYKEADYRAYDELKTRYDHLMHEWEKASYELELIEEN